MGHIYTITIRLLLPALLVALFWTSPAVAVERIKVLGLFASKAMVEIDGRQQLLKAGQTSREGVLLVSANAREAVIEVDGRRESYGLGSQVGGQFAEREVVEVRIWSDARGSYHTTGSINGRLTNMLVDTGATSVAMSEVEAKRLGIPYRTRGTKSGVRTASGYAPAYTVMLDRVQVGGLKLHQVEAVVIKGSSPQQVLLGMTFLSRVKMEHEGEVMVLQSKF